MTGRRAVSLVRYLVLSLLALLFLLPFYVLLRNGFSTDRQLAAAQWRWLPDNVNLDTVRRLFANQSVQMGRSLVNSAVVSVVQTGLTVLVSALAGYGLARIDHKLSRLIIGMTVLTLMVPTAVTFIPNFVIVSSLGWISTLRGLIVPVLFSAFATFVFRQFFLGFPHELEEAAFIDGAGYWRTFWRVVMPNAGGVVAAVGVITFIGSWNSFLWPLLIGQDRNFRTVQVALSQFMSSQRVDLPALFVGAAVTMLPVLAVFIFLQRYLVQGVERTGID